MLVLSDNFYSILHSLDEKYPNSSNWEKIDRNDPRLVALRNAMGESSIINKKKSSLAQQFDLFQKGVFLKRYKTVTEASKALNVSKTQIRTRAKKGLIFDSSKTLRMVEMAPIETMELEISELIGIKIRKIRKEMDLSQKALGERIGMSQLTISNVERGIHSTKPTLGKVAEALDVDLKDLMEV